MISRGLDSARRVVQQDKIKSDQLGPREHGERDERRDAGNKPQGEHAYGAPAPLAASVIQDRLRNTASGIVSKRALALDQPARDVTLDGIRHRGHFIGFREHRAAITRVLHETILSLVATHLHMRDNVDPQARNVAFAHAAVEQVHVVWDFIEQGTNAHR